MVSAATWSGRPPLSAACRAGFCPRPAETTLPMMHSSTICGSIPARRTASATTRAPSWVAVKPFSAPRNFPVGVRTADTITDSRTANLDAPDDVAEQRVETLQDHGGRAHDFRRPLRARRFNQQHTVLELDAGDALDRRTDRGLPGESHLAVGQRNVAQELNQGAGKTGGKG